MSSTTESTQSEPLARFRREAKVIGCEDQAWLEELVVELEQLPNGTVVVINCATGEYVTAEDRLAGLRKFQDRFGNVAGWMHEIGGGLFIGGGIA